MRGAQIQTILTDGAAVGDFQYWITWGFAKVTYVSCYDSQGVPDKTDCSIF